MAIAVGQSLEPEPSFADTTPLRADVLLARNGRVYVALADSSSVGIGDWLTFRSGKKTAATAEVIALHDGMLAVASVTSGSLATIKKVSRLRVFHEPRSLKRLSRLRVGLPSGDRSNLLVSCGSMTLHPARFEAGYRVDTLDARSYRLVRGPETASFGPDTLLIRLFEEAVDEEIALERGEVDVALFWPGELSVHMRENPRWIRASARSRGALTLLTTVEEHAGHEIHGSTSPYRRLRALDRDFLRGDLEVKPESVVVRSAPDSSFVGRFTVDLTIPGRIAIERFLNQPEASTPRRAVVRYRVAYLEGAEDTARALVRLFPNGNGAVAWSLPLNHSIVVRPEIEPHVRVWSTGALANLVNCNGGVNAR